jgi:nitrite reductase (NADH) small subunit
MTNQLREHIIASTADFPEGTHRVVELNGRKIGVFNIQGNYNALPSLCPHQLGPLCSGKVFGTLISSQETDWQLRWEHEGEIVTCPWHGLEFHIPTGQCLAFSEIRLRSSKVWVEDGLIKIRLLDEWRIDRYRKRRRLRGRLGR